MDELSLLAGRDIAVIQAAERRYLSKLLSRLPAPDFTGSLDYIDSLASRSALALSQRNIATIATAAEGSFSYLSPLNVRKAVLTPTDVGFLSSLDFRPLGDARRFDPEFRIRPPRALVRSSARVVSPLLSDPDFPAWRPKDPTVTPDKWRREYERESESIGKALRRSRRHPFANYHRRFSHPNQVIICLKRKIRRQVMAAAGQLGRSGFHPPVRTYWSSVVC